MPFHNIMHLHVIALVLLLVGCPTQAFAAPNASDITYDISLLRESSGTLSVDEIATQPNWTKLDKDGPAQTNFGFTLDTFWIRLHVTNSAIDQAALVIDYPLLDDIILYRDTGSVISEIARSGDTRSIKYRDIVDRSPIFKLSFDSQGVQKYYLRIRTGGSMQVPISLMSIDQLLQRTVRQNSLFAAYYGFMIVLSLVAAIATVQFRERVFAYYLCYVISMIGVLFSLNGYAYLFFWPDGGETASVSTACFVALACLFGALFAAEFLRTRTLHRSVTVVLNLQMLCAIATLISSLASWYPVSLKLAVCTGMITVPTILYATVIAYFKKIQGSSYFIAAWGIFLAAVFTTGFVLWGVVPTNLFTSNIMQISSMIDVVVVSMALVNRANSLRAENVLATERANLNLSSLNEQLEKEVANRTQQLTAKNQQLADQAVKDSLTELLNHRTLLERLGDELSAATRFKYSVAVIMMDVDHFKSINDSFGHQAGDETLQEIATTLRMHLRHYDICGRYGGDEFIIVLSRTSTEEAMQFTERLRYDISSITIPKKPQINVTASFGISVLAGSETVASAEELVAKADHALYEAKGSGRNVVRFVPIELQAAVPPEYQ